MFQGWSLLLETPSFVAKVTYAPSFGRACAKTQQTCDTTRDTRLRVVGHNPHGRGHLNFAEEDRAWDPVLERRSE